MNFTKDYVVLGRLGQVYFQRSQQEPSGAPSQHEFLIKSIDAYTRALAVDPEDLPSHDGLSRCYAALGVDAPAGGDPVGGTAEEVAGLVAASATGSATERTAGAVKLADAVTALGRKPPNAKSPRLKPLQAARERVQTAYAAETDLTAKAAQAIALASIHRELQALLKPDELAKSATMQAYRSKHPAHNAAAEAIVIYPTNRESVGK